MILIADPVPQLRPVQLSYPSSADVRRVRVIGDFNEWSAPGQILRLSTGGDTWTLDLALPPGVYRYVLLTNNSTVPTGAEFREQVKVVVLTPPDYRNSPGALEDGSITASAVSHDSSAKYVRRLSAGTFALRLRTRKDDVAHQAVAVWTDGGEQKDYPMKPIGSDPLYDYFEVKVAVNPIRPFLYRFLLDDGDGARAYDLDGLHQGVLGSHPFRVRPQDWRVAPPSPGVRPVPISIS